MTRKIRKSYKRSSKTAIALVLSLALVAGTVSACGSTSDSGSASGSAADMPGGGPDGAPPDGEGPGGGGPGGSDASDITYTAVREISEDTTIENDSIESTGTDESAVITTAGTTTIKNTSITKTSSDSTGGDNSSFYGVGAAVLAKDEGTVEISDSSITTDSQGGAGAFAYGNGVVKISNTSITTTQGTSGGIHVAGGGTLYATNVSATTNGESSAAIRSDRGGGTMRVSGGDYTSNGTGSPAVYCTADIEVENATLEATNSEAICIEGRNTLRLYNCNLTGNIPENEQNDCDWNVILYQSMSGDSEEGNSVFEMQGGTLTARNGGMFYTTNTESTFILSNVNINYAEENDFFLKCTSNENARGWGTAGENGADCSFTAISQQMQGDVIWDSTSELDFYMTDSSTLTGTFTQDTTYTGSGYASVYIDSSSKWTVTGDATVTNLYNEGTIVDEGGKTVTIVVNGKTEVNGDSSYTITVTGEYATSADFSGAGELSSYSG